MNVAQARLQVYQQELDSDHYISELLHAHKPVRNKSVPSPTSPQKPPSSHFVMEAKIAMSYEPAIHTQQESTIILSEAIAESINASCLLVSE